MNLFSIHSRETDYTQMFVWVYMCVYVYVICWKEKATYVLVNISALNFMCRFINMELIMLSVKDWIMNRKTG